MWTAMKKIFADKNRQEEVTANSGEYHTGYAAIIPSLLSNTKIFLTFSFHVHNGKGLDYCIIRPGGLTVDKPTGIINVIDGQAGSIARADVAQFCLDAVKVDDFPYLYKAPCIR